MIPLQLDGAVHTLDTSITQGTPTAVGCYNDSIAIAVVAAARHLGLDVPADISVMGVGATDLGQLVSPRLTSVRIDSDVLLPATVEDLAAFLRGEDPAGIGSATEALYTVQGETT